MLVGQYLGEAHRRRLFALLLHSGAFHMLLGIPCLRLGIVANHCTFNTLYLHYGNKFKWITTTGYLSRSH